MHSLPEQDRKAEEETLEPYCLPISPFPALHTCLFMFPSP